MEDNYGFEDVVYSIEELEALIANNKLTEHDWEAISKYQGLTEPFIEKYKDKVVWFYISIFQELSEVFIERYSDKVNWNSIILYQSLNYAFMEKHLYKYSLYNSNGLNQEHIFKLQEKYKDKYYIDKLEHELNR